MAGERKTETASRPALRPRAGHFVEARLVPSPAPSVQVFREAICGKAVANEDARLVLFHAPAGFGKSTAMLQVLARMEAKGAATAWLTLDRVDNSLAQFVSDLSLAILSLGIVEDQLVDPIEIVEALLATTTPFAIFIDCLELIEEDSVFVYLKSIIEKLPANGRLMIASRTLPSIGLARLRGVGWLLEIGPEDLRFSLKEAEQFFRLRAVTGATNNAVRRLYEKTEGWITGLWLASLSIERQSGGDFVDRFSGSSRDIADYLTEEVLAQQPQELQKFLFETSVLRALNVSLCQAVVPDVDSAAVLKRLVEQNLFLVHVPGHDQTFRYHSLFADYLKKRLNAERPDRPGDLHLAASRWFADNGRPVPAIDHAIEARQFALAASLLNETAQRLLEQGRMRLLSRWLADIPDAVIDDYPRLKAVAIWAALFTRGPLEAADYLEKLSGPDLADERILAHVNALRPLILAMQDRYQEARAVGPVSLEKMPTGDVFADSVLCNAMANIFANTGDVPKAQDMIDLARKLQGESTFNHMYAESLSGMLDMHRARLKSAIAKFRIALNSTRDVSYRYTGGNAWAGIFYASAMYETNELDVADQLLNVYLPMACDVALPDHMITGHLIRTRIAMHDKEVEEAFGTLAVLEHLGHRRRLPRLVASARLERSYHYLLQGDSRSSREELDRAADPAVWMRLETERLPAHEANDFWLGDKRWQIHFGDARAVVPLLQAEHEAASQEGRNLRALKLRILECLALQRSGEPAAAMEMLATILRLAAREGFVRLLVDEGAELGRLVARFYASLEAMPAKLSDPVLVQYVRQLIAAFGQALPNDQPGRDQLMEALTQKEIRIIQLVADGRSNAEISQKLSISDSTVRTHLRSINQKLNAKSRAEAAAIARRLDVVR